MRGALSLSPVFKWGLKGWLTRAEGGLVLQQLAIWLHVWASTHSAILPLRGTSHPFPQAGAAVLGRGSSPAYPEPQQPRTLRGLVLCRLSQSETSDQDSARAPGQAPVS